ncbi:MAG: hypothetical protein H5U40_02380 [Polyangiaceae bacterium]|nr:hypothetical protein [Polyangiaceae bacterium]
MALSPVSGLLGILALHLGDPNDPAIEPALAALEAWAFDDEQGGYRLTGARSQTWDTAFALSALVAARHAPPKGAVRYLADQQIPAPFPRYEWADRLDPTGGFCFAHREHGWPVSDCTAEALVALFETHAEVDEEAFHEGVRFLLRCQNRDGSFGSYEARRTEVPLEALNPSEMFLDCMTEGSYVECTASCIAALALHVERFPVHRLTGQVRSALRRATTSLLRSQRPDGSWKAAWGVSFIYGTLFGIRGLRAAGLGPDDPAVERAVRFLLNRQRPDGGFGEHHSGALLGRFVALPEGQVVQTAWALLALLDSGASETDRAIDRAARFIVERQEPSGGWPKERMSGVFFGTALVDYDLYRFYFPVWALGLYQRHLERTRSPVGAERARALPDARERRNRVS